MKNKKPFEEFLNWINYWDAHPEEHPLRWIDIKVVPNGDIRYSNPTTDDKITTNEQPIKNNDMTTKERIEYLNKLQELYGNKELVIKIEIQNGTDTNNN
jgi:hypothetical protein